MNSPYCATQLIFCRTGRKDIFEVIQDLQDHMNSIPSLDISHEDLDDLRLGAYRFEKIRDGLSSDNPLWNEARTTADAYAKTKEGRKVLGWLRQLYQSKANELEKEIASRQPSCTEPDAYKALPEQLREQIDGVR